MQPKSTENTKACLPGRQSISNNGLFPGCPCPADVAARLAQREQQDVAHKRKLRGRREGAVLDPCRLGLAFSLVAAAGEGEGERLGAVRQGCQSTRAVSTVEGGRGWLYPLPH